MREFDDPSFGELEVVLRKLLYGDETIPGLYRNILSAPSWEVFLIGRAQILAYEGVLVEMRKIVRRLNGEPPEPEPMVVKNPPERAFN